MIVQRECGQALWTLPRGVLSAIVWLYRGQQGRFLLLVRDYLGQVCTESTAIPEAPPPSNPRSLISALALRCARQGHGKARGGRRREETDARRCRRRTALHDLASRTDPIDSSVFTASYDPRRRLQPAGNLPSCSQLMRRTQLRKRLQVQDLRQEHQQAMHTQRRMQLPKHQRHQGTHNG